MGNSRRREDNTIDICDALRSRCCVSFYVFVASLSALMTFAPSTTASVAWRLLPNFESAEQSGRLSILPAILLLGYGVAYHPGDDWALECMKERCPTESFFCLLDRDCRSFVSALYVGVDGTGGGLCSRDVAREAACGTSCSRTTLAFQSCLEGPAGSGCTFATDALPVVVHHGALDEASLTLIDALAREQMHMPGNHVHRKFGSDGDGNNSTTGHVVTWLTPAIYRHDDLLRRYRDLAYKSAATGGWHVEEFSALNLRCAEVLEYGEGNASGLGWHWDVGSTVTMVTMLHPASDGSGELQVGEARRTLRTPAIHGAHALPLCLRYDRRASASAVCAMRTRAGLDQLYRAAHPAPARRCGSVPQ